MTVLKVILLAVEARIMPVNIVGNQRKKLEHKKLRRLGFSVFMRLGEE
jgi:hypothetical protein